MRHWRGARDERSWPYALERGKGVTSWPWEKASAGATFAKMIEVQRASAVRMSVRSIADTLSAANGKPGSVSKDVVHRAIQANRAAWNSVLVELGYEPLGEDE